jgi:hypothetical protein
MSQYVYITCHFSSFSIFTGPSFPCVGCDCTSFDHSGDHFHKNFELALPKKYIWVQPSFCHWFGHLCESNLGRVRCGFGRVETHPHQKPLRLFNLRRATRSARDHVGPFETIAGRCVCGCCCCWVVVLGGGVGWCWVVLAVVGCCWLLLAVVGNTTCVTRSPLGLVLISAFDIYDFFLNTMTDHSESGGSIQVTRVHRVKLLACGSMKSLECLWIEL